MGIELLWEEESGDVLARVDDPLSLVQRFLPSPSALDFACLRFVDPYGDTIFNTLQLPFLLEELRRRSESSFEPKVIAHLQAVLELVNKAQGHVHTYVRFVGD